MEVVPHVLLFPVFAQGHVPPMLNLAELLSNAGFYITFVNTEQIHQRFLRCSPVLDRLAGRRGFRFRTIPDGLPNDPNSTIMVQFVDILDSMATRSRDAFKELLVPTGDHEWPPVTCVVLDGTIPFAFDLAEELGIPAMLVRTSSACSVWAYYSVPELVKKGELPFPEDADLDKVIEGVVGMEGFLRCRDLPQTLRKANDQTLQYLITISTNLSRARALILNTFESLDAPTLSLIRSICPTTYAVGPLHLLNVSANSSASIWQKDQTCISWLDSQPAKSVVYVSFGSTTTMSKSDLLEFWHGLIDSGHRFLWVLRPDLLIKGDAVPREVEEGTRERGCLVEWAPQEEVLCHPAVGCFLTHSGWNSTIESMAAGVPMICWPFHGDQHTNSRFVSEVWKIGLDMKDMCGRGIVEMMVREVMDGDRARELRKTASEMAAMAREGVEGGSSTADLQKLIDHIKSLSSETAHRNKK